MKTGIAFVLFLVCGAAFVLSAIFGLLSYTQTQTYYWILWTSALLFFIFSTMLEFNIIMDMRRKVKEMKDEIKKIKDEII